MISRHPNRWTVLFRCYIRSGDCCSLPLSGTGWLVGWLGVFHSLAWLVQTPALSFPRGLKLCGVIWSAKPLLNVALLFLSWCAVYGGQLRLCTLWWHITSPHFLVPLLFCLYCVVPTSFVPVCFISACLLSLLSVFL